jgi:Enoyl-CoA hydratase/isomerase
VSARAETIDAPTLLARFSAAAVEELGGVAGRPLLLVEPDNDGLLRAWSPGVHPVVVVGLREPGWDGSIDPNDPFDIVLGVDDPLLIALIEMVQRHPIAATSLAVHLRNAGGWTVEHGLSAESALYSTLQAGPEFTAWRRSRPVKPPPDERELVLVARTDDCLHITLNRPQRHNALNQALRDALTDALTLAVVDDTIAEVRLTGAGPSFSSGGDLDEFGSFPDPATAHVSRLTRSPAWLAHQLRDRLVVELHGACMGAGIEIPAFAGRVLAAADTVISLPELGVGLIPGAGGTVSLTARIGRHRTLLLALTATRIDANTAQSWGLVNEIRGDTG